jgi:sugar-phosphatase
VILACDAILFDLDGTLVSSLPAVDRAWSKWALKVGLVPEEILPKIHGRRSIDSVRVLVPHLDAEVEDAWLQEAEASDTTGVTGLEGAVKFVRSLPPDRWSIVTSGTYEVATPRIRIAGLPLPNVAVYGNDVRNGKPAPDPFLLAAEKLGVPAERCLVFEDTIAGLTAGRAAGCKTIGVRILPGDDLAPYADVVIRNYDDLRFIGPSTDGYITLTIG